VLPLEKGESLRNKSLFTPDSRTRLRECRHYARMTTHQPTLG